MPPTQPKTEKGDRALRPLVVGLVGGVGAGKSTVARLLGQKGAVVADADRFCHEALADPAVAARVSSLFGPAILDEAGRVQPERLRPLFADPRALGRLEAVLHPVARARTEALLEAARRAGKRVFVVDAPLLLEAGWEGCCDVLVFVDAPAAVRRARAAARGIPPEDWARREARQWPLPRKKGRCHYVLDASGDLGKLEAQVEALWRALAERRS